MKKKIAFIGQPEYFRCLYEHDLNELFDVKEYKLVWSAPWYYYSDLIEFSPDISFFFRPELYPDELLSKLSGKKIALSSEPLPLYIKGKLYSSPDREQRFHSLKKAKKKFDLFFHFDKNSIQFFVDRNFPIDGDFVFPVASGTYRPMNMEKKWDIFFGGRDTVHRDSYLSLLKRDYNVLHINHGIYGDEYVRLVNQCKIGMNIHTDKLVSLEHRIQNMMACGIMVMSEQLSPNEIFVNGEHYIEFRNKNEFWDKFLYYLRNDSQREVIARNGLMLVRRKINSRTIFSELVERISKQF